MHDSDDVFLIPVKEEPDNGTAFERLNIIDLADMIEPGPTPWLVPDFIPEGYPSMIYSAGGTGKSYLAQYLAFCLTTGRPFLGRPVRQGNILYADFELDRDEQRRRAAQVARGLGVETFPRGLFYFTRQRVNHSITSIIDDLSEVIGEHDIKLTIIDSIGFAIDGDPEAARDVVRIVNELKALGTVLLIDHQSKTGPGQQNRDKMAFGSVYKTNAARSVFQLQEAEGGNGRLTLEHKKSNFDRRCEPIALQAYFTTDSEGRRVYKVELCDMDESRAAVLGPEVQICTFLKEQNATAKEIEEADVVDLTLGRIQNICTKLKKAGRIHVVGKDGQADIYSVTESRPYSSVTRDTKYKVPETLPMTPVNEMQEEGADEHWE